MTAAARPILDLGFYLAASGVALPVALAAAHSYFRQPINRLLGPYDRKFDAEGPNPRRGLGLGALNDSRDTTQGRQLEAAAAEAELGLATEDLAGATSKAATAETSLTKLTERRQLWWNSLSPAGKGRRTERPPKPSIMTDLAIEFATGRFSCANHER